MNGPPERMGKSRKTGNHGETRNALRDPWLLQIVTPGCHTVDFDYYDVCNVIGAEIHATESHDETNGRFIDKRNYKTISSRPSL